MPVTAYYPPPPADAASAHESFFSSRLRPSWGLRRLVVSAVRIADLQIRIWLTKAKITAMRVAIFAALFAIALTLAVLSVIFLFIGVFKLLIDVAGLAPVWAFLIMAGATLLCGALFAGAGVLLLRRHADSKEPKTARHHPPVEPSTKGAGV